MRVRPLALKDTDALFAAVCSPGDGALWTYRATEMPIDPGQLRADVLAPLVDDVSGTTYAFEPIGRTVEGFASFFPAVPQHGVVEISGVLFGPALQRTTAATEAIHLMLRHAFDELGYRRVEWKCDSLNEPSRRAALRLGFSYEGRFHNHIVVKRRNRDTDWFAITDRDWPALRSAHERWLAPANFDAAGRQRASLTGFVSGSG